MYSPVAIISCSVYVPKIVKVGWQYGESYYNKRNVYFLANPV